MNVFFKSSIFKYSADDWFFFAFNISMGFLPPFITLISDRALQFPLILIAVLIYFRLLVRPKVLARFAQTLKAPNILLIFALVGLLIYHATITNFGESDRLRILLKPGLVLLVITTMRYSLSNQSEIDRYRLSKFLLSGLIIGLLVIAAVSIWNASGWVTILDQQFELVRVKKLNRALEVGSVLIFLGAVGIRGRVKAFFITIGLALSLYWLSFIVTGSAFWSGVWHPRIHVTSETVQFGMPIAFIVFLLAQKFPRLMTNMVFGGMCAIVLTAPWIYQFIYKILQSSIDLTMPIGIRKILFRGEIWDIAAKISIEAPILGLGIDSTRYLGNIVVDSTYKQGNVLIHPHNMILQLWLDLGLAGALIIFGLLAMAWRFMKNVPTNFHPDILGGMTMLFVFSTVSHSLWQTWSIALIAIFIVHVSLLKNEQDHSRSIATQP